MERPGERKLLFVRRQRRPDGTLGPDIRAPWTEWDVRSRFDKRATFLLAAATAACASSLYRGAVVDEPASFRLLAPAVAGGFFVGLVAMLVERERHGLVRVISVAGAAVLVIGGAVLTGVEETWRVLVSYWFPAALALGAAIVLQRGHRMARAVAVGKRPAAPPGLRRRRGA